MDLLEDMLVNLFKDSDLIAFHTLQAGGHGLAGRNASQPVQK